MLKEQTRLFNNIAIFADLVLIILSLWVGYLFRAHLGSGLQPFREYIWILFIVIPIWYFLLAKNRLYASIRRLSLGDVVARLANVHVVGGAIVAALIYFIDRDQYSRGLYLFFLLFSFTFLTTEKAILKITLSTLRRRGLNIRYILIVGTREKAKRFHELLELHAEWGFRVVGFLQIAESPRQDEVEGHPVLGNIKDLVSICKAYTVDEVVFCLPKDYFVDAESYVQDLEELGITVRMVLDFYEVQRSKRELSFFHNELPILTFHSKAFDAHQLFLKRTLDILGALAGLLITAVLFPFIFLAIRISSPGPIFFGQNRVGTSGRIFKCLKFRSMYIDAEARKQELMAQNEMKGAIFKIKDDPRVTPVGKFLRKTSLDELPQFWNVLRGEMSLVGTRPPTPDEVSQYQNWHRRRISIKPGITGMWQVSGRNRIEDFDEIVRLDLKYIDQWNLWLDVKILLKTVGVVLARRGSC